MRRIWRCGVALIVFYLYDHIPAAVNATASSATTASSNDAVTCATGSVNWITHTLPQQCLRTAWVPSNVSSSAEEGPVTTPSTAITEAPPAPTSTAQSSALSDPPIDQQEASQTPQSSHAHTTTTSETVQSSQAPSQTQEQATLAETDADSALHDANFLSFEEWKKQKIGDAGQSAEALARVRSMSAGGAERQRPGAALDTLGEDSEIDLDFSGFGTGGQTSTQSPSDASAGGTEAHPEAPNGPSGARSKDAGRTCKERFNYASFDCAANVLKTNPKCKSSSAVLVENKDSYMLNECSMDNKFLIVELCEYIQIDTVVLANFEFFSSMFRTFRVSVSDRYPVKIDKWQVLGTYEARNTREIQAFLVENPLIWAKYIRIEFLTHYGNEYYCPLSLLRVHGTTMMEDYRHQEELARGEVDTSDDETEVTNEVIAVPAVSGNIGAPEAIITPLSPEEAKAVQSSPPQVKHDEALPAPLPEQQSEAANASLSEPAPVPDHSSRRGSSDYINAATAEPQTSPSNTAVSNGTSGIPPLSPVQNSGSTIDSTGGQHSASDGASLNASSTTPGQSTTTTTSTVAGHAGTSSTSVSTQPAQARPTSGQPADPSTASIRERVGVASTEPSTGHMRQPTPISGSGRATNNTNSTVSSSSIGTAPAANTQPATQESFFKTLSKRLSLLEANATLSLQYIEAQSMLLRDAFTAVEKRQIAKTASFLSTLNDTVLKELSSARSDYDQLWQSTVLELANQREEGRRERELLNEQVRLLAEEVVGQRRLMAVQVTVVLIVLGLFLFTKAAPSQASDAAAGLGMGDIRILQGMQALMARGRSSKRPKRPASHGSDDENRSHSRLPSRWGWESPPAHSPGATRPATGHGMDETQEDAWDDLLAFVDENVRPRQRVRSDGETHYLKQKPLPPAPRPELTRHDSETGDSEELEASSAAETPLLPQGRVSNTNLDGSGGDDAVRQNQGRLGVAGRIPLDRRTSAMRAAKSAPTTPRTENGPILGDDIDINGLDTPESGAGSGVSESGSIGLGIDIE